MPKIWNLHRDRKRIPADAVYVGRPTMFGNRYSHIPGKAPIIVASRGEAVVSYAEWLQEPEQEALRATIRKELRGKDLVCWCAPHRCHAEVLMEVANAGD